MTRVTTITEYSTDDAHYVNAHNDKGLYGSLVYSNDEAMISVNYSDEHVENYSSHPADALVDFLAHFFDYEKPYTNES